MVKPKSFYRYGSFVAHLAKEEDESDGDHNRKHGREQLVEEDRQRFHARRVAYKQRDQEKVLILDHRDDAGCRDTHAQELHTATCILLDVAQKTM